MPRHGRIHRTCSEPPSNAANHPEGWITAKEFEREGRCLTPWVRARIDRLGPTSRTVHGSSGRERTERVLPVIALQEIPAGPPHIAASSAGAALKAVHDGFRRELDLVREEIAASGPGLGAQLRIHCLTLCQGLRNHHTGEDAGMFPMLGRGHPELAPALERMRREHEKLAVLLGELQQVISAKGADSARVLAEVERLTGEVERHLDHEEGQLIPILDGSAC